MKMKLLLIVSVVVLAIIGQYFFLPESYRGAGIKLSGWLIMLSVAMAVAISIWLIDLLVKKLSATAPRNSRIGSYIGAYGIYPFALFLGFIVGGNFGGAIGENVLGSAGTIVGIGIGVFIVTIIASSVFAVFGFLLGGLTQKFVK